MNENFDLVRKDGRLLYEYIRGSHLYNLHTVDSDTDTSGVYICTPNELLGMNNMGYKPQISDSKHDNTWFEIGEYARLLLKSNPTVLESLFIPKDKIIGNVHPFMQMFLDNKDEFISKQCFMPFYGYAASQIEKARGLNKKITQEQEGTDVERKSPYDFIYTFHNQGSTKVRNWLANHGLKQEYCGLVNIPNMHDMYGLYYDWGMHIINEKCILEDGLWDWSEENRLFSNLVTAYFSKRYNRGFNIRDIIDGINGGFIKPLGYKGIIKEDGSSNELRLSSIDNKDDIPLIYISYNESGYTAHCKRFNELQQWKKERNVKRYESNLDKNYDSKNMMHCFRMVHMAKEIAEGQGVNLERTWDREFLMDIRAHKFEYDDLIERLTKEKDEMNEAMRNSTIREKIDVNFVNDLLIDIRKKQLYSN